MIPTGGESDSAQIVEHEDVGAGDVAGALQRGADAGVGHGLAEARDSNSLAAPRRVGKASAGKYMAAMR